MDRRVVRRPAVAVAGSYIAAGRCHSSVVNVAAASSTTASAASARSGATIEPDSDSASSASPARIAARATTQPVIGSSTREHPHDPARPVDRTYRP